MRIFLVAIFATVVVAFGAVAAADDARTSGRALVESFVNDVSTFSARFEQTLLDANGDLIETSSGELLIRRPGQFRWAYEQPYEQWLVADGLNIWSYDVDLAQVTVKPQAEALANTPALLLGGSSSAMDEFVVEETSHADEIPGLTWVRMRPSSSEAGFRHVDLGFVGDTLDRMVFFDNLEQTTLVLFSDVVVDQPIDDGAFDFVAPDDVDVVGSPALAQGP